MKKPKILLLPDRPNWAYDFCADELVRYLGHKYEFEKAFLKDVSSIRSDKYDAIFDFCSSLSRLAKRIKDNKRTIASIRSYSNVGKYPEHYTASFLVEHYAAISILCEGMREVIPQDAIPIFYTPLGVDTSLFRPIDHKHKFTIGFAGNCKRFWKRVDIIKEAARKAKVPLKIADKDQFSHAEMPHFYKKIDCYVCMSDSKTEGGPNTAIEAASCGKAIISTNVGVVADIIGQEGGVLVPYRDTKALIATIERLRCDKDLTRQMGQYNRQVILKKWTWKQQVKNYEQLFDFVLERDDGP